MSFVFAEKHFDESLKIELFSISCDTKIIPDNYSNLNFSKQQMHSINKWGIIKSTILSPDLCISFAGNNIKYAGILFNTLFEIGSLDTNEVQRIALDIHKNAESIDDIEFIISSFNDDKFNICCIKNQEIYYDCKSCYIGSPKAYSFFRSKNKINDISTAFADTVNGCPDNSVGGFPIRVIYGIDEQSFVYAYSRSFTSCRSVIVKQGEAIPFFLSGSDGGFSYEINDCGIDNVLLSVDQIEHQVLYSRSNRSSDADIDNINLSGLMLPMEVYNDNGVWKRYS